MTVFIVIVYSLFSQRKNKVEHSFFFYSISSKTKNIENKRKIERKQKNVIYNTNKRGTDNFFKNQTEIKQFKNNN